MKNLCEVVKNREPLKIYLDGEYYDTFSFNEKENIYQGRFGYIELKEIMEIALHGCSYIKLESVE